MRVGQWMTKEPLTIGPKESIVARGDSVDGFTFLHQCGDCHLRRTK